MPNKSQREYELKDDKKEEKKKQPTEKELLDYDKALHEGREYLKKFEKAYIAVDTRPEELREAIAFYEGDQNKLSSLSDTTPWVVQMKTPHAKNAIDTRVASITASDYVGELFPLAIEDIETVTMLNDLLADEWERLNLNFLIDTAIKDASYMREGYIHFTFDSDKTYGGSRDGVIEAVTVDSSSIFIDPNARKWKDAQYIVITGRMPKRVAKDMYGRIIEFIKPSQGGSTEFERGEISIGNDYQIEQDHYYTVLTFFEKKNGEIKKSVVIEDVLVDEVYLDGLKTFPIAQFRWGIKKQNCYGISLMDDIITLQKAINSIESAITNTAIASASPAVVIQKGQGLNPRDVADTIGAPSVVYAVNGDPRTAIVPLNTQSINAAVVQIKAEHERALKEAAGLSDQFMGALGTSGNTTGGSQMAIERAKIIEGEVLRNVEEFVEQITQILVQYITTQYAGEFVGTVKKDQTTDQFQINNYQVPEKAKDIQYKFYINLALRTPYSKEREKEAMMELWQMERQYDAPTKLITVLDILGKYNITNKKELIDRYKRLSNQSAQDKTQIILRITSLSQQFQLPQELVQAAITEIVSEAKETPITDQLMQMVEQSMQQQQQQEAQAQRQQQQMAQQQQAQNDRMLQEVAQESAGQIVGQMAPDQVVQMSQEQSMPNQIAQMMGGMQ